MQRTKNMVNKRILKTFTLFGIAFSLLFLLWKCKNKTIASDYLEPTVLATHYNGEQFVGSTTCAECHADIYESYMHTAHYNTSSKATEHSIKGSFKKGKNTLELQDATLTMLQKGASFYQETEFKFNHKKKSSSKLDIVIGSGVKGQTYLHWEDDKLYQLQASYFTPTNSWINSPSFPKSSLKRPITDACLKCHVTFAKNKDYSGKSNTYDTSKIIYGIDCERCHRPSAKHVTYHRANPNDLKPKHIIKIDTLNRTQHLDICAQCHSGLRARQLKENPFSFLTGERLDDYAKNYNSNWSKGTLDVHGNQYGLLKSSKCFKNSETLNCTTCHNPHENQRAKHSFFNQKCISCHNEATTTCSASADTTKHMDNNCIACHMPLSPSKSMKLQLNKNSPETPVYIRTHLIDIYPEVISSPEASQ